MTTRDLFFEVPFSIRDLDPLYLYQDGKISYEHYLQRLEGERELNRTIQEARDWRARSQNSNVLVSG
jgi:hypothetical protein